MRHTSNQYKISVKETQGICLKKQTPRNPRALRCKPVVRLPRVLADAFLNNSKLWVWGGFLKSHDFLVFIITVHTSCSFTIYFPQVTVNKSYSCEGLGLREVPEELPVTTEILDFSFNMLPSLQNSTFSELKSLLYLDLTRYGRSILTSAHQSSDKTCPYQSQRLLDRTTAASPCLHRECTSSTCRQQAKCK